MAIIQRFGAALNLNVHVHALVLDGVFEEDGASAMRFHPATAPTDDEMDAVIATIDRRVGRLLARRGLAGGDDGGRAEDPWVEAAPVLAGIAGASVQGRVALGQMADAEVRRCGGSLEPFGVALIGPCHARWNGFDLHAGVVVPAGDRPRLERVCRYAGRDGARAARPCAAQGQRWADLMRRAFGFDVLVCPRCGGRLRLIALIDDVTVIRRILRHLGLPTDIPDPRPARAPPIPFEAVHVRVDADMAPSWSDS